MPLTDEQVTFNEETTAEYTATMQDEDGTALPLSSIDAATLTLYDQSTGDIINSRNAQNIVNTNNVTIHATSGLLTWVIQPDDNVINNTIPAGSNEHHIALFQITYSTTKKLKWERSLWVKQLEKV